MSSRGHGHRIRLRHVPAFRAVHFHGSRINPPACLRLPNHTATFGWNDMNMGGAGGGEDPMSGSGTDDSGWYSSEDSVLYSSEDDVGPDSVSPVMSDGMDLQLMYGADGGGGADFFDASSIDAFGVLPPSSSMTGHLESDVVLQAEPFHAVDCWEGNSLDYSSDYSSGYDSSDSFDSCGTVSETESMKTEILPASAIMPTVKVEDTLQFAVVAVESAGVPLPLITSFCSTCGDGMDSSQALLPPALERLGYLGPPCESCLRCFREREKEKLARSLFL